MYGIAEEESPADNQVNKLFGLLWFYATTLFPKSIPGLG